MTERKATVSLFKSILCTSGSHTYCYRDGCNCSCHLAYFTSGGDSSIAALAYELVAATHAAPTGAALHTVSAKALKTLGHSFTADEVTAFTRAVTIAQGKDYWSQREFEEDFARLRAEAETQSDTLF